MADRARRFRADDRGPQAIVALENAWQAIRQIHKEVSGRYYHLKQFRDRCLQYELDCKFANTRYGWTITEWPEDRPLPFKYRSIAKTPEVGALIR